MTGLKLAWLCAALAGSIGPGLLVARKLRWSPIERLAAAVVFSQAILYLLEGVLFVARAPHSANVLLAAACIGCAVAARAELASLWAARGSRRAILGFGALFLWILLLLAVVRSYAGGMWRLDWVEHYERTLFFLEHRPLDTILIGIYSIPARPPMMNLLAAHFLAASDTRFEFFQVVFSCLNLLVFFPACLLLRLFARPAGRGSIAVLFVFLALNPLLLNNAAYTWTKGLANFQVLCGLYFYVRGIGRRDFRRLAAAFTALGAGILVHYSAAPFALVIGFHYVVQLVRGRSIGWPRGILALVPAALLLVTWVGWSTFSYGVAATFGSNSTVTGSGGFGLWSVVSRTAQNLLSSIVPHPLRISPGGFQDDFFQPSRLGALRDYVFLILQTNLVFAVGTVSGLFAIGLAWSAFRRPKVSAAFATSSSGKRRAFRPDDGVPLRAFWFVFVVVGTVFAIAMHPTVDPYGVVHVVGQPLVLLGVTLVAARFGGLARWAQLALLGGLAVDFTLGVFLQFSLEHWPATMSAAPDGLPIVNLTTDMPNHWAVENGLAKIVNQYRFLGDHVAFLFPLLEGIVLLAGLGLLGVLLFRPAFARAKARWIAAGALALPVAAFGIGVASAAGRPSSPFPVPDDLALNAAAAANPDSVEVRVNLGIALMRRGLVREAILAWSEGYALDPRPGLARYFPLTVSSSYTIEAPPIFEAANSVQMAPRSAKAQLGLGGELWKSGHQGPALRHFEEAVRLDSHLVEARRVLATAYIQLGREKDALPVIQDAIRDAPANPDLRYIEAGALFGLGNRAEAIAALRETLRLKPDHAGALNALRQAQGQ